MSILQIFEYPDPILKKKCEKVSLFNTELDVYVKDLTETMQFHKYCVGLAAPQAGILKRIITIDVTRARKPQPGNGLLVLINPTIIESSNFKIVREGCLSIPDFTANVKRAMSIKVQFHNVKGETIILNTQNFEAHAIQHEMDHLDGVLFLDRITSPATDLFRRAKY